MNDRYYIMYEDHGTNPQLRSVDVGSASEVEQFIEEKINIHAYRLDEFKVIRGRELPLGAVRPQTRVTLTLLP